MSLGFAEMVAIAAIALVVIGPEKFPDFAKLVIRAFRDIRGYVDEAKQELAKELRPVQKEINVLSRESREYVNKLSQPVAPAPAATPSVSPAESPEVTTSDPVPPTATVDAQNTVDADAIAPEAAEGAFEHVEAPLNLDNPESNKQASGMNTYNTD